MCNTTGTHIMIIPPTVYHRSYRRFAMSVVRVFGALVSLLCLCFGLSSVGAQEDGTDCTYEVVLGLEQEVDSKLLPCLPPTSSSSSLCPLSDATTRWIATRRMIRWSFSWNNSTLVMDGFESTSIAVLTIGSLLVESNDSFIEVLSANFSCDLLHPDGSVCAHNSFLFSVTTIPVMNPPQTRSVVTPELIIGQTEVLCISGTTVGVSGSVLWSRGGAQTTAACDLTGLLSCPALRCVDCQAHIRETLPALLPTLNDTCPPSHGNESLAVYYLTGYSGNKGHLCASLPDKFLSVLYVGGVAPGDSGTYEFSITSAYDREETSDYTVQAVYLTIEPKVVLESDTAFLSEGESAFFLCHANTSHNDSIHWTADGVPVTAATVQEGEGPMAACAGSGEGEGLFSVVVVSREARTGTRGAVVREWILALVVCSAVPRSAHRDLSCGTSDQNRPFSLTVISLGGSNIVVIAAPTAVVVFLLLILALVLCAVVVRRFRSVRKQQHTWERRASSVRRGGSIHYAACPYTVMENREDLMEFPRSRLQMQEIVGQGQFGQVLKAVATGICADDSRNVVAVKTLKPDARREDLDDLQSELNVMRHMEPHPNILNFLGQCSETNTEPLYILMEFAVHGSLKSYLERCRTVQPLCDYHSLQSPTATGLTLDPILVARAQRLLRLLAPGEGTNFSTYTNLTDYYNSPALTSCAYRPTLEGPYDGYAPLSRNPTEGGVAPSEEGAEPPPVPRLDECPAPSPPSRVTRGASPQREVGMVEGELRESMMSLPDGYIFSPSTVCSHREDALGPEPECLTPGAGPEIQSPPASMLGGLTFLDFIDFALQIARGMEHLEKMKCVHRDLAARNVLIAEGFLLKVGDFGLARELNERDYYRKISPGRVPVRWMAVESLDERVHSYKSDVWSYGVLLWEILMYGAVPYGRSPSANTWEGLLHYITRGNRLRKPPGCRDDVYALLLSCWSLDPAQRPPFTELVSTFDSLLSAAHGYLTMLPDGTTNEDTLQAAIEVPDSEPVDLAPETRAVVAGEGVGEAPGRGAATSADPPSFLASFSLEGKPSSDSSTSEPTADGMAAFVAGETLRPQRAFSRTFRLNEDCQETEL